jgi:ABC-type branched-subunit amino acid transport system ATPase component
MEGIELLKTSISDNFSLMVNSLKLAQRAELWDDEQNENIVEKLYVDPLPHNGLLRQVVQDNTVFLVGRKGTGKSTIFARVQEYFRKSKNEISAYVDVKTIYGKSQAKELNDSSEHYEKILLYEGFINEVIYDLIKEVKKNLEQKNALFRLWKRNDLATLLSRLEEIKAETSKPTFKEADILKTVNTTEKVATADENEGNLTLGAHATATNFGVKGRANVRQKSSGANEIQEEYSHTLLRHFNLNEFISNITSALKEYGIKKLHIILDDFSEIDYGAQQVFVNTLLAPLNNWSDKFIRFKVAAYPVRSLAA